LSTQNGEIRLKNTNHKLF